MQDLLNKDGIGITFTASGGVILVKPDVYLGKIILEKDGYTAIPDREYKYGTVWEDECKLQGGFNDEYSAALYLVCVATTHSEYSDVEEDDVSKIKELIKSSC